MGSIQVDDDFHTRYGPWIEHTEAATPTPVINGDGFRHFDVAGLASDDAAAVSGMREEIVLLSWLIVLWRTREDTQVSFDWAYRGRDITSDHDTSTPVCLSTDEIATGVQTMVDDATASISRHLMRVQEGTAGLFPGSASLVLSTETTSRGQREDEEVSKDPTLWC